MEYAKPKRIRTKRPNNTTIVKCPICRTDNLVFSWSFGASGKKCKNCNFLMDKKNINQVVASLALNLGTPQTTFRIIEDEK